MATTLERGQFPYVNSDGEVHIQDGRVQAGQVTTLPLLKNWAQKTHPDRPCWVEDENRQRASYIATRKILAPFLVPHRFEGNKAPKDLMRARLAYGIGLNKAYLHEIFGHIRSTPTHYTWGLLQSGGEKDSIKAPVDGVAAQFWWDADGKGKSWKNFFEGDVLEWMVTSVGGFVLVDSNRQEGMALTERMAQLLGIRSSFKFIPWSWVEDIGTDDHGFWYIKIAERDDISTPKAEDGKPRQKKLHLLFELLVDGRTQITRWDDEAKQVGPAVYQRISNAEGVAILPLIPVKFGDHPEIEFIGSGLLMGLDDIVIDLFNLLTEIREAYRDAAFGFHKYKGDNVQGVKESLAAGSRLVDLGNGGSDVSMDREAADPGEVTAGLAILDLSLKCWSLSAKRRAIEMVDTQSPNPKSGISLKAEFQLDLRPLLVSISENLDMVETQAMYIMAQLEGQTPQEANQVLVRRETEFQLEQEASRIARIVKEFLEAIPEMPPTLLEKMMMRWAESIDFLEMDEIEVGGKTLRDTILDEVKKITAAMDQTKQLESQKLQADINASNAAAAASARPKPASGP